MSNKIKIELMGIEEIEGELQRLSKLDLTPIQKRSQLEVFNRGKQNTPVGDYKGGGQLRKSLTTNKTDVGYTKEYAPHVEYGHRTKNGGFVQGQFFLKKNIDTQKEIYHKDLKRILKNERGEF